MAPVVEPTATRALDQPLDLAALSMDTVVLHLDTAEQVVKAALVHVLQAVARVARQPPRTGPVEAQLDTLVKDPALVHVVHSMDIAVLDRHIAVQDARLDLEPVLRLLLQPQVQQQQQQKQRLQRQRLVPRRRLQHHQRHAATYTRVATLLPTAQLKRLA